MRLYSEHRRVFTFGLGAVLFCIGLFVMRSGSEPAAEEKETNNPFAVPETDDAEKLLEFIEEIRAQRPGRPSGPAEYRALRMYQRSAPVAIAKAAEKILTKGDKKSSEYADASAYLLESKIITFRDAEKEERAEIVENVREHLEKYGVRRSEAGVAYGISQMLEEENPELAAVAYSEFGKLIKASDEKEIRDMARLFEGPGRRLSLLGSEMEVFGTTLDGEEFNWKAYRGKVVLIDFWATWCRPCLAELPNVKEAYEKYHDKGFEVVGVSIDADRAAVEQYLEKNPLPWPQLHQEEKGNALAERYGVNAIPFIVLVGKDGKVISIDARGPKLHQHLEEIYGESGADE